MVANPVTQIRVLYDARSLKPQTRHWGPGVVTSKILEHLPKECITQGIANYFPDAAQLNIKCWPHMGILNKALFELGPFWADPFDVYWGTNLFLPLYAKSKPSVVTVHDLLIFDDPNDQRGAKYFQKRFASSIQKAHKILTDSKTSADRLLQLFPNVSKKVEVALLGYEMYAPNDGDNQEIKQQYEFDYLIMLGAHRPRKRLDLVLQALEKTNEKFPLKLVLTGNVHVSYNQLLEKYGSLIVQTGVIEKSKLMALIKNSKALVFPTNYEGFGFPVLEGMAVEAPVICSDIPILREIGGNAAIYVDFAAENWSKAINDVCESASYVNEICANAKDNLKRFSWYKTAAIYEAAFHSAIS